MILSVIYLPTMAIRVLYRLHVKVCDPALVQSFFLDFFLLNKQWHKNLVLVC